MKEVFGCVLVVLLLLVMPTDPRSETIFFEEELSVSPSPATGRTLNLPDAAQVVDFDVSPRGLETAGILKDKNGRSRLFVWNLEEEAVGRWMEVPGTMELRSLAWHPRGRNVFVSGKKAKTWGIWRVDLSREKPSFLPVLKSPREIRRIVPGPRPFMTRYDPKTGTPVPAYRIFYGSKSPAGTYSVRSITEEGDRDYQVLGLKSGFTRPKDSEFPPSLLEAASALPSGFHPAGHLLIFEDGNHCFHAARYDRDHWGAVSKIGGDGTCGGSITVTPNGLGLLRRHPDKPGVTLLLDRGKSRQEIASEFFFRSTPSSVPDGRGIVGLVKNPEGQWALAYIPIAVPLADVVNAWMFAVSPDDRGRFMKHGGLFRDLPLDQLYSLYESEAYECGGYDRSTPTRPYLVTTDIFWELYAAAYEGLFLLTERKVAVPAFGKFIETAARHFREHSPDDPWGKVFSFLERLLDPSSPMDEESRLAWNARGRAFSPVLDTEADYGELKPRGHYTATDSLKRYFMAFKYLTDLAPEALKHRGPGLESLPPEVKRAARAWIEPYRAFIAPSRTPVAWSDEPFSPPPFHRRPIRESRLFPLSWGFDNEVLYSTVFQSEFPPPEQILGAQGPRVVPSGLDVAAALGSDTATAILGDELERYPNLGPVLRELRTRFQTARKAHPNPSNLYDRWLGALAFQWAEEAESPNGAGDRALWKTKRLQTGLASWATLRHATVLVNERTAAECGEGGFEPILMHPPRGYVEADPKTFGALADLFLATAEAVKADPAALTGSMDTGDEESPRQDGLKNGVVRWLTKTAQKARLFEAMARKEQLGQPLTDEESLEILLVGRVAEHHFLVFKSLAAQEYALSNPDPMPKIADAAGGGPAGVPFLMVGVGRPLEWDHIVPHFGRRQVVKGAGYSYYEFPSSELLDDAGWLDHLPGQPHPSWVAPFVSKDSLGCPAPDPF